MRSALVKATMESRRCADCADETESSVPEGMWPGVWMVSVPRGLRNNVDINDR